ncbi:hypothetical protein HDK64DRAFT_126413 [Phyllosticta capitalensis]
MATHVVDATGWLPWWLATQRPQLTSLVHHVIHKLHTGQPSPPCRSFSGVALSLAEMPCSRQVGSIRLRPANAVSSRQSCFTLSRVMQKDSRPASEVSENTIASGNGAPPAAAAGSAFCLDSDHDSTATVCVVWSDFYTSDAMDRGVNKGYEGLQVGGLGLHACLPTTTTTPWACRCGGGGGTAVLTNSSARQCPLDLDHHGAQSSVELVARGAVVLRLFCSQLCLSFVRVTSPTATFPFQLVDQNPKSYVAARREKKQKTPNCLINTHLIHLLPSSTAVVRLKLILAAPETAIKCLRRRPHAIGQWESSPTFPSGCAFLYRHSVCG